MKTARDELNILTAYRELGSYRAAAALCGTTHKTVCRVVARHGQPPPPRPPRSRQADAVADLIEAKVRARRRAHQRQATAAAVPGGRLHRFGAQPAAGSRACQGRVAAPTTHLSALDPGARRASRHRLGRGRSEAP